MLSWLSKRPKTGEAIGFLRALALEAALPYCVLASAGRGGFEVATLGHHEVEPWIAKRAARRLYVLTADATSPLRGRAISEADLVQTRIVSIAIPAANRRALDAFLPAPAIIAETPKGFAAAWRLRNPTAPAKARELSAQVAAKLHGTALDALFPVPGHAGVRLLQHLKGPDSWALVTAFDDALGNGAAQETGAGESLFVSAAAIKVERMRWLWPGIVPLGDLTLIGGAPKMGKSQIACAIAATLSSAGQWPTGERAEIGSAIVCELEDNPATVVRPRLEACKADLARIAFGRALDLSQELDALKRQAAQMPPPVRLAILSPVGSFFGPVSNDDVTVRQRLAPLLSWAKAEGVAIVGITHPLKNGSADVFSGSDTFRKAARAVWRVEIDGSDDEPLVKRKRRLLVAMGSNVSPDDFRIAYRIEGHTLPGGIETSRVVFSQHPAFAEAPKVAEVPKPRTMSGAAAKAWLAAQLADGPRNSGQLADAMKATGLSWDSSKPAVYRAAAGLNIARRPIPGSRLKMWVLP